MTKELYRYRIANGLCGICGEPNNGHSICDVCLARLRERRVECRRKRRDNHQCSACGRYLPTDYYYTKCEKCKVKEKKYYKKHKNDIREKYSDLYGR